GTLRPILKSLADNYLASSKKGKYRIETRGINHLKDFLDGAKSGNQPAAPKLRKTSTSKTTKKKGTSLSKADIIVQMGDQGFIRDKTAEEIRTEMIRKGFSAKPTSMPALLLPFLKKGLLNREQKAIGDGEKKVWEYTWLSKKTST